MLEFFGGLCGLALVVLYAYVGAHAFVAELKTGQGVTMATVKAATWPLTLAHTIKRLYDI